MELAIIAALGKNRVIGEKNQLPWHLPADLAHFKKITLGKPVIMGRKTYESIGKPLPNRRNIILSRKQNYKVMGAEVVSSFEEAIDLVKDSAEVMIIGGAEIITAALPHAHRLYLTFIEADFPGDTFFPDFDLAVWQRVSQENHQADEKNPYNYRFVIFERRNRNQDPRK